jgi:NAD dependent epimerase/dehydratase family enzyme
MKIIIAAGTGFLVKTLKNILPKKETEVYILTETQNRKMNCIGMPNFGRMEKITRNSDVLINLAGKSVDCRYTEKNQKKFTIQKLKAQKFFSRQLMNLSINPNLAQCKFRNHLRSFRKTFEHRRKRNHRRRFFHEHL